MFGHCYILILVNIALSPNVHFLITPLFIQASDYDVAHPPLEQLADT